MDDDGFFNFVLSNAEHYTFRNISEEYKLQIGLKYRNPSVLNCKICEHRLLFWLLFSYNIFLYKILASAAVY